MPSLHISGNHNITFLHVPKNGGTAICSWLRVIDGEYNAKNGLRIEENSKIQTLEGIWLLSEVQKEYPKNFTFAVVRNPWERAFSAYDDLTNNFPEEVRTETMKLNGWSEWPSFEQFIKHSDNFIAIKSDDWRADKSVTSIQQSEIIDGPVDLIVRFEDLNNGLKVIREMFETESLVPIEENNHKDYRDYYTDETKNIIANMFKDDIERWKYTF